MIAFPTGASHEGISNCFRIRIFIRGLFVHHFPNVLTSAFLGVKPGQFGALSIRTYFLEDPQNTRCIPSFRLSQEPISSGPAKWEQTEQVISIPLSLSAVAWGLLMIPDSFYLRLVRGRILKMCPGPGRISQAFEPSFHSVCFPGSSGIFVRESGFP